MVQHVVGELRGENEKTPVAVVFVHGFLSSINTWNPFLALLRADPAASDHELLTFGYPTRLFRLNPAKAIPGIEDIADALGSYIDRHMSSGTPLVLVGHSQGGLVIQRFIANMLEAGRGTELRRLVRVVLFACPNDGSEFFLGTRRALFRRNAQERRLRPLDELIRRTQAVVLHRGVFATEITESQCPLQVVTYAGIQDGIVSTGSAKGFFVRPESLDADHSSIVQPNSTADERYLALIKELTKASEHAFVMGARETRPFADPIPFPALGEGTGPSKEQQPSATSIPPGTCGSQGPPAHTTGMFGRAEELLAVTEALGAASATRSGFVLISGVGGSGKSTLAECAALESSRQFPDGVLRCDLGNAPAVTEVTGAALDRLLVRLGAPPGALRGSVADKSSVYQSLLAGRRILVVIENAAEPDAFAPLIPEGPGSRAIVTTRKRFDDVTADLRIHLDGLRASDAVDLLRHLGGPGPATATEEELKILAALCGYMPLALSVIGSLLRKATASEVDDLIRALRSTESPAPLVNESEVHTSLRQSYASLSAGARTLLRRLSLLPRTDFGPWLAHVALADSTVVPYATVTELASANLVEVSPEGRMRMHDLVLAFARERVAEEDGQVEAAAVTERLVGAYASRSVHCRRKLEPERPPFGGTSAHASSEVQFDDIQDPQRWLEQEHVSLVAMMEVAAERGLTHSLTLIANSLPTYYVIRGTWNDWETGLQLAARAAEYTGDLVWLGYCLQALANIARTRGLGTGRLPIERSYRCFTNAGDAEGQAYVLNDLGLVEMYDGVWDDSLRHLQQSETALRELGNDHLALHPVRNRGITLLEMGDVAQAVGVLEEAVAGFRTRNDARWQAFTLGDLGKAYRISGDLIAAGSSLSDSIHLLEDLGETRWAATTKIRYGDLQRVRSLPTPALDAYREAAATFESIGDPLWAARARVGMSLALAQNGDPSVALATIDDELSTFRRFNTSADECWAQVCRYRILEQREPEVARQALAEAHRIATSMGYGPSYVERLRKDAGPDVR